ncbi:hypothetical protein LWM68_36620 [Niabella sp. W65]|nr:hypothetical protein [Niabella sp. W65]MCH7367792.1 hypothetical protein [Niabella sp. W65]ULT43282.1 hypothetical protein KRR40_07350 [Niabella sp. I65]
MTKTKYHPENKICKRLRMQQTPQQGIFTLNQLVKMNKCYLPALALLITLHAGAQQPDKPNIIVFMVDDMGIMDTSVPFAIA